MAGERPALSTEAQLRLRALADDEAQLEPIEPWDSSFPVTIGIQDLEDLGVEFFGQTGVITAEESEQTRAALVSMRSGFQSLDSRAQRSYDRFLGKGALDHIRLMAYQAKEEHGTDLFGPKIDKLGRFMGYVISQHDPSLSNTGS